MKIIDRNKRAFFAYSALLLIVLIVLLIVTECHKVDLSIPYVYSDDALYILAYTKSLINNEWFPFFGPQWKHCGAPFATNTVDMPMPYNISFLIIKFISFLTVDYVRAYNYYFLLSFFLSAVFFMFAIRHFKVSFRVAIVFSVLYAFLPYHFRYPQTGLLLYCFLPLQAIVLLWIWSAKPVFFKKRNGKFVLDLSNYKAFFSIIASLTTGNSIYYSFFFIFLTGLAGLKSYFQKGKSRYHLLTSVVVILIISSSAVVNVLPTLIYSFQNGKNNQVMQGRSHLEAARYGLIISNLFFPVSGHRNEFIREIKLRFDRKTPWYYGIRRGVSLGAIGAFGVLSLLLFPIFSNTLKGVYNNLSFLTISAIFISTVGGFGYLIAIVFSHIRTYERMTIIIATFSFFFLALFFNDCRKKWLKTPSSEFVFLTILFFFLFMGIYDTADINFKFTKNYPKIRTSFLNDRDFIARIEKSEPQNALIFQLPFDIFPGSIIEPNRSFFIEDWSWQYCHLKGYLHASDLYWSYGSVKGREATRWYRHTAKAPIDKMIENIVKAGFSGIYIDRFLFTDGAVSFENELKNYELKVPIVSNDKRYAFYSLTNI